MSSLCVFHESKSVLRKQVRSTTHCRITSQLLQTRCSLLSRRRFSSFTPPGSCPVEDTAWRLAVTGTVRRDAPSFQCHQSRHVHNLKPTTGLVMRPSTSFGGVKIKQFNDAVRTPTRNAGDLETRPTLKRPARKGNRRHAVEERQELTSSSWRPRQVQHLQRCRKHPA